MKEVDIRQCWRSIEVPTASAQICPVTNNYDVRTQQISSNWPALYVNFFIA